mmetsp:Transcript_123071/g.173471  ORF Transcript_123071/g.173471 Transcript_123071/m.173471 type:complete len:291 (+) Transcript_123071:35-907(+)
MIPTINDSPHFPNETLSVKLATKFLRLPFQFDNVEENDSNPQQPQSTPQQHISHHEHTYQQEVQQHGVDCDQSGDALPIDFQPTPYTVIVGRGKVPKQNLGNKRLRILASNLLSQYSEATDKRTKTRVVNEIVMSIKHANGLFVKKDKGDGRWYQVDDSVAREKIGYVFRDLLSDKYRSSSKSKVARRHKEQVGRASLKLERAMQRVYPTSLPIIPTSAFLIEPPVPEPTPVFESGSIPVRFTGPPSRLCRAVSLAADDMEYAVAEADSRLNLLDRNDFDVDSLMKSVLI